MHWLSGESPPSHHSCQGCWIQLTLEGWGSSFVFLTPGLLPAQFFKEKREKKKKISRESGFKTSAIKPIKSITLSSHNRRKRSVALFMTQTLPCCWGGAAAFVSWPLFSVVAAVIIILKSKSLFMSFNLLFTKSLTHCIQPDRPHDPQPLIGAKKPVQLVRV